MAKSTKPSSAVAQLEDQIATIRREAYNDGYAAAMLAVMEFTAGTAKPETTTAKAATRGARAKPAAARKAVRGSGAARKVVGPSGGARRKTSRGDNARHVVEAMAGLSDRTGSAAAIRKALADKGINMPYTSIRNALGQLQARGEASVAGKTWTYTAPAT